MKKLLIKIFCGVAAFSLIVFIGYKLVAGEKVTEEISTTTTQEDARSGGVPEKETLLSAPPSPEISKEESKEESKIESSVGESKIKEESEVIESSTEESYEVEEETKKEIEEFVYVEPIYEESMEEYEDYETYDDGYVVEDTMFQFNSNAIYTPADFQNMGIINWGGWTWTFYSQRAMPGEGLIIPGRHVDEGGYVCDENDYICLASSSLEKGTIVDTPLGKMGKVYDCGCLDYILDVYVDWTIY